MSQVILIAKNQVFFITGLEWSYSYFFKMQLFGDSYIVNFALFTGIFTTVILIGIKIKSILILILGMILIYDFPEKNLVI